MVDTNENESDASGGSADPASSGQAAASGASDGKTYSTIPLSYGGQSQVVVDEGKPRLALFGNLNRDPVFLDGIVRDTIPLRESLSALYAIVGSDYRYVPKDRTAYHAFRRMRRSSENLNQWQAQRAYFDWLARNDPLAFLILDPVVTVHPDKLFFEVFSKDEGTYANLSVDHSALDLQSDPVCGTTNIDFSEALFDSVQRFRSYRETRLIIGQEAVKLKTGEDEVLEKQIQVPDSWLRGFLQVQSASLMTSDSFKLQPLDLYNTLRYLRMHGDIKGKRRGLRVELIPGERPRIVLEPWEEVLEMSGSVYSGDQAKVVRLWGRRRLMLIQRMLPFIDEVEVFLLGSGLPSFWVLRAGPITLTLGMTCFTASNWSSAINFDLMMPRGDEAQKPLERIVKHLGKEWSAGLEQLAKATKLKGEKLADPLQAGCQNGQLMYDLPGTRFRLRPLTSEPLPLEKLQYRNQRERLAHDLVDRKDAVTISAENRIAGVGVEITGKAVVAEDGRDYRPQMLIGDDGFIGRAECTCNTFRRQGLKTGPCTCLIALRLAHAIREKRRRESGRADKTVTVQTRSFSRRKQSQEETYQLSLERKKVRMRWGTTGSPLRAQLLVHSNVEDARADYLGRIEKLQQQGYLDASE
ncbi:MAG: hypothetical protein Aurels2KO_53370 [Aureliella sp.]